MLVAFWPFDAIANRLRYIALWSAICGLEIGSFQERLYHLPCCPKWTNR
jgi:hypothetical protein